jgi:hypothetical protein
MSAFSPEERSFIHNADARSYMETLAEMADSPTWKGWSLSDRQVRAHSIWTAIVDYRFKQKQSRTPAAASAGRLRAVRCG